MILAREFTERGSDLVIACVLTHAKDFVVIVVAHKFYSSTAGRDQQFQIDFPLLASAPALVCGVSVRSGKYAQPYSTNGNYSFTSPSTTAGPSGSGFGFVPDPLESLVPLSETLGS